MFIKRLHLRENWPLWVGGISLALSVIALGFQYDASRSNFNPQYNENIIYWGLILQRGNLLNWFVLSCCFGFLILAMLFNLILRKFDRKEISTTIIGLVGMVIASFFIVFNFGVSIFPEGNSISHVGSAAQGVYRYQLAVMQGYTDGVPMSAIYLIYKCDSIGLRCDLNNQVDGADIANAGKYMAVMPKPAFFAIDATNQTLYLMMDGEHFPIIP